MQTHMHTHTLTHVRMQGRGVLRPGPRHAGAGHRLPVQGRGVQHGARHLQVGRGEKEKKGLRRRRAAPPTLVKGAGESDGCGKNALFAGWTVKDVPCYAGAGTL